ncbi:hypothetical protein SAMN06297144_2520 [Sphingomonas guangdongensis]|uniref:Uncharacterized protein n=1 Tax=Sphingomonas guangdongensis TaxID=1141890 RepID=A0A285R0S7_9SPHN|nr:hypothetical protein SAMN06297144_2520 [Sphingomonas guangdongensis]
MGMAHLTTPAQAAVQLRVFRCWTPASAGVAVFA